MREYIKLIKELYEEIEELKETMKEYEVKPTFKNLMLHIIWGVNGEKYSIVEFEED